VDGWTVDNAIDGDHEPFGYVISTTGFTLYTQRLDMTRRNSIFHADSARPNGLVGSCWLFTRMISPRAGGCSQSAWDTGLA
jgi:hypothetical protein